MTDDLLNYYLLSLEAAKCAVGDHSNHTCDLK